MAITKRLVKGSALSHTELDGNFTDYETFKALLKQQQLQKLLKAQIYTIQTQDLTQD